MSIKKENLEKLAAFLDNLPPERFDYGRWASRLFAPDACGTTACALGWATTIPEFGMKLMNVDDPHSGIWFVPVKVDCRAVDAVASEWGETCAATQEAFGIDEQETEYLFVSRDDRHDRMAGPTYKASAKDVAAHIRDFLEVGIRYLEEEGGSP